MLCRIMSYVETAKTMTAAFRFGLALPALLALNAAQAGDAGGEATPKHDPAGETVTVTRDVVPTPPPPKQPVINDPLFSILDRMKDDSNDKAAVIDLGDGPG